jgi:hypothetical protein
MSWEFPVSDPYRIKMLLPGEAMTVVVLRGFGTVKGWL